MDEAARICTRLLVAGVVSRNDLPELDHTTIRTEVENRLSQCGLSLATSAYSDYIGLRLSNVGSDATVLDSASNLGFGQDACALLVVLWARLSLQKRTIEDTRTIPGEHQINMLSEGQRETAKGFTPSIRFDTLVREFGQQLGGRVRLKMLLGQLRRLQFINYTHLDNIQAGPLLELGIDGERMVSFIRSRVLSQILEKQKTTPNAENNSSQLSPDERVFQILQENPSPVNLTQLEQQVGIPRKQLRVILVALRKRKKVAMTGAGTKVRYQALKQETS